jgi:multiple sugar transport system substrate-binding protein
MWQGSVLSRRRFLATAGAVGAAVAMAGCAGPRPAAPRPAFGDVPPALADAARHTPIKELSVLSQQQYLKATNDAMDAAYQAFAQQTGTKITNAVVSGEAGTFIAKQDAAVKAGNVQDTAFGVSRFVAQLHELDDIVDVSDVVTTMQEQYGPPSGVAADLLRFDGRWYGIPFYTIGAGVFLRNDWLTAKGIKSEDITTWDAARDAALEISDPSKNQYGWGVTINRGGDANAFIENLINAWGGAINADDGRRVIFNSPETVAAVTWIGEIFTSDKYRPMLPPGILSWTDTGNNEAWLAGTIGLTVNNASLYAQSKETGNPVYGRTAVAPGFTGRGTTTDLTTSEVMSFVVFKNAKNPDLAKLVAQYMATGPTFLSLVQRAGAGLVLPAWDKVWTSDPYYLDADPIFRATHEIVTKPLPLTTSTGLHFPQTASAGRGAVQEAYILTDMMGQVVQGGVSPQVAVRTAHDRMVQTFEQLGIRQ